MPTSLRSLFLAVCTIAASLAACTGPAPAERDANPGRDPALGRADARREGALRIVSWNIRHGRGMDDAVGLERTFKVLRSLAPDVVALQEVDRNVARSGTNDQPCELGSLLGMEAAFGAFMPLGSGEYGCAILSRFPIREARPIRLPEGNEPRVALEVDVELPGGEIVTIVNIHLDWVEDDGFRFAQATMVADRLRLAAHPAMLLGDFNDQPGSRTLTLLSSLGDLVTKPAQARCTFPSPAPEIEIDHLVTIPRGAWQVEEIHVIDERVASDHRPVLAVVRGR